MEGVFDAAVCTFDGFNYLTPDELRLTMAAVALHLRPAGWLVFDLHTDLMMDFTISNAVVAGESAGNEFVISSVVDAGVRTCDTTIELTKPVRVIPLRAASAVLPHGCRGSRLPGRRRLYGDRRRRGVHTPAGGRLDPARHLVGTSSTEVILSSSRHASSVSPCSSRHFRSTLDPRRKTQSREESNEAEQDQGDHRPRVGAIPVGDDRDEDRACDRGSEG